MLSLTAGVPSMSPSSNILMLYSPACAPDAGLTELPRTESRPVSIYQQYQQEYEALLPCKTATGSSCDRCNNCNKRKRIEFEAYPTSTVPAKRPRSSSSKFCDHLKHAVASLCSRRRKYKLLTRYRYHKQKKPYSSISVHIEHLTSESYDEDDLAGIPDLIEVIRLQDSGPTEAARALRKKLKYGNVHRQLRSLTILDGLLQNGGNRLQRSVFADEPLLERLRIAASDPLSDQEVRAKCKVLFGQWAASSKEQPGLEGANSLYRQLPKKTKGFDDRRQQSRLLRENEEESRREDPFAADEDREPAPETRRPSVLTKASGPSSPKTSISHPVSQPIGLSSGPTFGFGKSSKKKNKVKGFSLEKEKPAMLQSIAASSVASTNLNNALKLVNREHKRVSDDHEVAKRFETCKQLRRQILRYIQYVESDDYLGGLIHANEELITALMAYEVLDKSVDDDSDSEYEEAKHLSRTMGGTHITEEKPKKPPRPGNSPMPRESSSTLGAASFRTAPSTKTVASESESEEDDDDDDPDDPFGDRNAATTPRGERKGYSWREV